MQPNPTLEHYSRFLNKYMREMFIYQGQPFCEIGTSHLIQYGHSFGPCGSRHKPGPPDSPEGVGILKAVLPPSSLPFPPF